MGLYFGNQLVKILMNNEFKRIHIGTPIKNSRRLLSFDRYYLKSSDNFDLIPKEE